MGAQAFKNSLRNGTCAGQGYTVVTSTEYTMPSAVSPSLRGTANLSAVLATGLADVCSLYAIEGAVCGQSDLDCAYAGYAQAFKNSLRNGTCAGQGYTVVNSTATQTVPVIGEITITEYTNSSVPR